MGLEAPSHWLVLAVIVAALFGYRRMPEVARSVGRSLRIFKTEMTDGKTVPEATSTEPSAATQEAAPTRDAG